MQYMCHLKEILNLINIEGEGTHAPDPIYMSGSKHCFFFVFLFPKLRRTNTNLSDIREKQTTISLCKSH